MQATFQGAPLRITGAIAAATLLLRLLQQCRNFLVFFHISTLRVILIVAQAQPANVDTMSRELLLWIT